MKTHKLILLFSLVFCIHFSYAQDTYPEAEIKVLARNQKDKILLRWAPNTPSAWMKNNNFGYTIERYTVKRNGQLIPPPHKKTILVNELRPEPLSTWEEDVKQNDYAAILAQSLYGENFSVEQMQEGGLAEIINKSKEAEQRFSFALFAADMNFEMAKKAGLGFEDTSVISGEEYLYRIKSLVPKELLEVKMGLVVVNTSKQEILPEPIDLIAVPDDKNILLTWEYQMFKSKFTSYYVERSEDGNLFNRLGDTPLVNLNDKPGSPAKRMYYVDTLSQNNKTYYYRVKGISPFGEQSPPSKVVSAQGIKKLTAVPHIFNYKFQKTGEVDIFWEFDKNAEAEVVNFELEWASQEKGPYKVVKNDISPASRELRYKDLTPSNYFKINAIGKNNTKTTSLTTFIQTIDSIPPSPPIGLVGVVDTLGVVNIKWETNIEKDMLGYRVFRGNLKNEEVSQLTVSPIAKTSFIDTVQIKSLNSKVYYQIVAVDKRFNMSDYSEKLTLKKPDIIPPSSPIFTSYKVTPNGVALEWINSSSDDVKKHQLYRKKASEIEKGWELIFTTDTISKYIDKKAASNIKYRYAIFAEDTSGLQSLPSTPITITNQNNNTLEYIKGFSGIANRTDKNIAISWKKMPEKVAEIIIYKSKQEGKPVLWKQIPATINKLIDYNVNPGSIYTYTMKVILNTGQHPKIKKIDINY